MALITKNNIHVWNPNNPWTPNKLLAQMPDGVLMEFANKTHAVNSLYALGFKDCAREINKKLKPTA